MSTRTTKENCWELMQCGRQPQGKNVAQLGECTAAIEERLDGVHGGVNAGRACWMVSGTLCEGKVQGTFAEKYGNCLRCEFYKKVGGEELHDLQSTAALKERLKGPSKRRLKLNCWEFKKCGRQPGGEHAHDMGVCPAAAEEKLDSVHDGVNAGRACWVVAGTLCTGTLQGRFAEKHKSCEQCDFYTQVYNEEWPQFKLAMSLLLKLEAKS